MAKQEKIVPEFNERGEVVSLRYCGTEFAAPEPCGIFEIQLRDFIGNALPLGTDDFASVSVKTEGAVHALHFDACEPSPGTTVDATAEVRGGETVWNITVHPGTGDFKVEWIDFPRIRLRRFHDGRYLLPFAEGTLIDDLRIREKNADFRCEKSEYPMTGLSGFYPGPAAVQFEAYLARGGGLFIGCRDAAHFPKTIDFMPDDSGAAVTLLQHFTGGADSVAYETVTAGFRGGWEDAAEIYRAWMESHDRTLPGKLEDRMISWLAKSPVLLIYPVRGKGLDTGAMPENEYFPYTSALPVVERYRAAWRNPLMALIMHWEGTAPWAPPYIWPPYGGEAKLRDYADALHAAGDTVGLYGSGIAWTQKSMIDTSYDRRAEFEEKHLDREVCAGPHGELYSRVCNGAHGTRLGHDLCPERPFTAAVVRHEIRAAAECGVDYLQYFDQNQGCASPLCYSKTHGHPALPGAWQTDAMRELLRKAQEAAGHTVLGCENAAAEPYIGTCRLNDLRSNLAWGAGGSPVPLYPYLFHEYVSGFKGNGVCLTQWVDVGRTPFFLQWEIAWNFVNGNLLSVVLKDGGHIHWHWSLRWSVPEPEQKPLVDLIGNLSEWRRGAASEFLIAGRMEKAPRVTCGTRRIHLKNRAPAECPRVESSAWEHAGRRAVILANYSVRPEPCRVDFASPVGGVLRSRTGETAFDGVYLALEVPPLDAVMLEIE